MGGLIDAWNAYACIGNSFVATVVASETNTDINVTTTTKRGVAHRASTRHDVLLLPHRSFSNWFFFISTLLAQQLQSKASKLTRNDNCVAWAKHFVMSATTPTRLVLDGLALGFTSPRPHPQFLKLHSRAPPWMPTDSSTTCLPQRIRHRLTKDHPDRILPPPSTRSAWV